MTIRRDNNLCPRLGADHANGWVRKNRKVNPIMATTIAVLLFAIIGPAIAILAPKMAKGAIYMIDYASKPGCSRNVCVMPLEKIK